MYAIACIIHNTRCINITTTVNIFILLLHTDSRTGTNNRGFFFCLLENTRHCKLPIFDT